MTTTAPFRRTLNVVWTEDGSFGFVEVWENLGRDGGVPKRVLNHRCRDTDVARIVRNTAARFRIHRNAITFPTKPGKSDGSSSTDKD